MALTALQSEPQPAAIQPRTKWCEFGQDSAWHTSFLLHEQSSVALTLAYQIAFQNKFPAARVRWHRRLREALGTSRSEGRSEEEDVFEGAIRPCRARESKSQISSPSGPEHCGDDGALVEPDRARFDER
jgi:hypothetical protein